MLVQVLVYFILRILRKIVQGCILYNTLCNLFNDYYYKVYSEQIHNTVAIPLKYMHEYKHINAVARDKKYLHVRSYATTFVIKYVIVK